MLITCKLFGFSQKSKLQFGVSSGLGMLAAKRHSWPTLP